MAEFARTRNKQNKAVRLYEGLIYQNTGMKAENREIKIQKINKRLTRKSDINTINIMVILKEFGKLYEYFKEVEDLIECSNRPHAYYELKSKLQELNRKDTSGVNATLLSVLNNSYELVEMLITHGASIHDTYSGGKTLLHNSVSLKELQITKLILDFEAYLEKAQVDFNVVKQNTMVSNKILDRENMAESKGMYAMMTKPGPRINLEAMESSHCKFDFMKLAKFLALPNSTREKLNGVVGKSLINFQDSSGTTVLHIACQKDNKPMVQLLLSYGACFTIKDNADKEPINY
mmetsp:Transcript_32006/g.36535  ORF Transcript_32006/g.36535 Transcript_32006/m.36535 type:complete len:291 (+) Transcript_32006:168-1040(+)